MQDKPTPPGTRRIASTQTTPLPDSTVLQGRYQVIKVLGVGGMGAVYQARDRRFANVTRLCAVKEMINSTTDPRMRQVALENFAREANILAALTHPSIPKIYDFFTEGERSYLVEEFIDGHDLEAILESTPSFLDEQQVTEWAIQICDVLEYLHGQKPNPIVFRDLKPSNIMVNISNWVMLVDFGIAKVFQSGEKGTMIGTEGYSPPEQYRGIADPRGDLYALGATLHHLLTKRDPRLEPPFTFHERTPRQINPTITQGMEVIIMRALEYEPSRRFFSATEMKNALMRLTPTRSLPTGATKFVRRSAIGAVQPLWQFDCEDEVRSSPCVQGAFVYIGAYDNNLYSLNTKTGHLEWKYPTEGGICSSPACWEGRVFVGSEDNFFYCLRADSGRIVWSHPTKGRIRSSARVALDHVFFGSDDGFLYAVNARSGREVWRYQATGAIRSTPFVWENLVFFGCNDGGVYAIDIQSGGLVWKFRAGREVVSSPVVAGDLLLVGSNDWNVYALDPRSGYNVWRRRTNQAVVSTPGVHNEFAFVGSADHTMYALEVRTGRVIWKYETGGQITSSAAVSEDAVYFGCADGNLYKLNHKTGELAWQFETAGPVPSSPAIGEDAVYFGSIDKRVYALPL